jgi:hypothetical protein
VTTLRADWSTEKSWFCSQHKQEFSSPNRPDRRSFPFHGCREGGGCFPGLRRPRRQTDHSPPSCAEVENARRCNSPPTRELMLGKHHLSEIWGFHNTSSSVVLWRWASPSKKQMHLWLLCAALFLYVVDAIFRLFNEFYASRRCWYHAKNKLSCFLCFWGS